MKVDSVRTICLLAITICLISLATTLDIRFSKAETKNNRRSFPQLMELAREKEATELSEALIRQMNRTAHYQGNLNQAQIINGFAILFFLLIFIRSGRGKSDGTTA